jgi:predicted transcriptional regulator
MITHEILKKMRKDAGMTQIELARSIGVSQAHIAKIENNKVDPRLSTVNRLLNILSTKTTQLCKHVMTEDIITIKFSDKATDAVKIMNSRDISQLPVVNEGLIIGVITETDVMNHLDDIENKTVSQVMSKPLPQIDFTTPTASIKSLFDIYPAVIITKKGEPIGIITKSDLIRTRTE